jgi:hypothetical protein
VNSNAAARPDAGSTGHAAASERLQLRGEVGGFRAIVSTEDALQVRGGWDMTALLPELAKLPTGLVLYGELVAPDEDGRPSFPRLSPRILPVTRTALRYFIRCAFVTTM